MFICTGNICRSAMAHWLFEKKLEEKRIGNIQVFSSGIYASIGDTPTYEAKRVMECFEKDALPTQEEVARWFGRDKTDASRSMKTFVNKLSSI